MSLILLRWMVIRFMLGGLRPLLMRCRDSVR
nr:MAG TPA: hypothetical protein [Caudoviricetes sp.]